jgi:hypothetical protein
MGERALRKCGAAAVAVCFVLLVVGCEGSGLNPAKVAQSFENRGSGKGTTTLAVSVDYCSKTSDYYHGNVVYECDENYEQTMEHDVDYTFGKVRGHWEANPVCRLRDGTFARRGQGCA